MSAVHPDKTFTIQTYLKDPLNVERNRTIIFLILLLLIAFILRMRNLGLLCFFGDEGLQALALKGMFEHGVPLVDSGLVYLRDALYLYLQYGIVKIFGFTPFWFRFPSVLFGTIVIIPAYFLGKMLFNRNIGLITALTLTFSQFEIELSRYARSYTLFQFMFVLALICFYQGFMLDKNKYKPWFVLAALLTLASHALGVVLFTLFLIPLLSKNFTANRKLIFVIWASGIWFLKMQYEKLLNHIRSFGDPNITSVPGSESTAQIIIGKISSILGHKLYEPNLSYLQDLSNNYWLIWWLLLLIPMACTVWFLFRVCRGENIGKIFILLIIVWSAYFHQYSLVLAVFIFYTLFYLKSRRELMTPSFMVMYIFVLFTFIFWSVFIITTPVFSLKGKGIITTLIGFPNLYGYFLRHYILGWPVMFLISLFGFAALLNHLFIERKNNAILFTLATLFLSIFSMSFFRSNAQMRYTFHLYPLLVMLFSFAIVYFWQYLFKRYQKINKRPIKYFALLAGIIMLYRSQDVNPVQAWHIADRGYATQKHPLRFWTNSDIYFQFHQDVETASLYLKDRLNKDDLIMAMGEIYHFGLYHWYTGKVDYIVISSSLGPGYFSLFRNGEEINYITGSRIIRSQGMFEDLLQSASGSVWLIGDKSILDTESFLYTDSDRKYFKFIITRFDFVGRDNMTFVAKLK